MSRYELGVDIGGTFTDFMLVDRDTGSFRVTKVPTTAGEQAIGFMEGIRQLNVPAGSIDTLVHGTTAGTNAVLERRGAKCGLITTRGFRDVLELGRRTRPNTYGMVGSFEAIVSRDLRLEVTERMGPDGDILTPLDENEVRAAVRELQRRGAEALIIHFLHSYKNAAHEERCAAIARENWPNKFITIGSHLLREIREYERGTTAAINGYIQPVVSKYIDRIVKELADDGFDKHLLVMQGNGGMMSARIVTENAAHTVMSGPAAGVIAAAQIGLQAGFPNIISCDMGGTSFDVATIRDGRPVVSNEMEIAYATPIRLPMVDVHTIGSGGGSIACVNKGGLLQVGPESAGSFPGPIGYGRGGRLPTIADANYLLGRLNPERVSGSEKKADLELIANIFEECIGKQLGQSPRQVASAILDVANNQMANAIRLVSVEKGHDPRDFALFAFGGAGPLHAIALARELGIPKVLVPRFPGITSALGCVLAEVRHDFVQTVDKRLRDVDDRAINSILREQVAAGKEMIAAEGVRADEIEVEHKVDVLFEGQTHILQVDLGSGAYTSTETRSAFLQKFCERFEITLDQMIPVLSAVRTTVIGKRKGIDLRVFGKTTGSLDEARLGTRKMYSGNAWHEAAIYARDRLPTGARLAGPAIIEQLDTTVVVEPGGTVEVDAWGNLIISLQN